MKKNLFVKGIIDSTPIMLGYIPVGIAFAVMARNAGFGLLEPVLMSIGVFTGAGQMMSVAFYARGSHIIPIIIATFILNLRYIIMSLCVFRKMQGAKLGKRVFLSFGIVDEDFAVFSTAETEFQTDQYFMGLFLGSYFSWILGSTLGSFLSNLIPEVLSKAMAIAMYAMFISLLLPGMRKNKRIIPLVLITALVNWLFNLFLPASWSLIISTLLCSLIGVFIVKDGDSRGNRKDKDKESMSNGEDFALNENRDMANREDRKVDRKGGSKKENEEELEEEQELDNNEFMVNLQNSLKEMDDDSLEKTELEEQEEVKKNGVSL